MSLYSQLFKENKNADDLLEIIGVEREEFGRYRDVYPTADGTKIIVYTRIGGPNRPDYKDVIKRLRDHRLYNRDWDDPVDGTYGYFEFNVPAILVDDAKRIADGQAPLLVGEKFEKEIKEMQDPNSEASKRAEEIMKNIQAQVDAQPNGGVIWM